MVSWDLLYQVLGFSLGELFFGELLFRARIAFQKKMGLNYVFQVVKQTALVGADRLSNNAKEDKDL